MKINLNDKGQVKVILVLATIVLLSTIILAAVALNESNETRKNVTEINFSAIDSSEPIIEITPTQEETQTPNEETITSEPQNEITSGILGANEEDVSIMVCGDNQEYTYDANLNIGWSAGESVTEHTGGYEESILTYEAFPQCVVSMEPYEVDMNCLTQYCTEIVVLNQLTGEVKTIWTQGEIW